MIATSVVRYYESRAVGEGRANRGAAAAIVRIAVATAAVEIAYAGRAGAMWALSLFWVGELFLYAAAAFGVTRKTTHDGQVVAVLLALGVGTFLLKVGYSPVRFAFPDEFQHLRSLSDILRTHHLFHPNSSLPVSPAFPGLEIVTSAVIAATGLSPFAAGLLVTGFAHVLLCPSVYVLFRAASASRAIAGVAAVIFATEPHFGYFDAIFGYQTIALPLFALAIAANVKLLPDSGAASRGRWMVAGLFAAIALLFTHHLTMLALLVVLVGFAVVGARQGTLAPTCFTLICVAATATWLATRGQGTINYLTQPIYENLLSALPGHTSGPRTHGEAAAAPLPDRVLAYAAVLCTLFLLTLSWWGIARRWSDHRAAVRILGFAAIAYPVVLCVRVFAGDSAELAGRALTFALVPVSLTVALVLAPHWRRRPGLRRPVAICVVTLLAAGGIVTGWPPWWERLPGPFRIASVESGVDRQNVAVAVWTRKHLPPDTFFAADFMTGALVKAIGNQDARLDVGKLFFARRLDANAWREIRDQRIRLFVVDRRMLLNVPASGSYFAISPPGISDTERLPAAALAKFELPQFDRIYDGGAMVIYRVVGQRAGS